MKLEALLTFYARKQGLAIAALEEIRDELLAVGRRVDDEDLRRSLDRLSAYASRTLTRLEAPSVDPSPVSEED